MLSQAQIQQLVNDSDEEFSPEEESESELEVSDNDNNNDSENDSDVDNPDETLRAGAGGNSARVWRDIFGSEEEPQKFDFKPERLGLSLLAANCQTELDFFDLFFDQSLLTTIVNETNRYSRELIEKAEPISRHSQWYEWEEVSIQEMKVFIGFILNMALNEKPTMEHYFASDVLFRQEFFTSVFSRRRFYQIFRGLHLAPPPPPEAGDNRKTRGHKVSNIVEHIDRKCREVFSPGRDVCVDESTIGFKGRVIFKCYNPQKPTKWGLRAYVVADSETGYVCGFVPYFGNPTTESLIRPDLPFTSRIVLHLLKKVQQDCPAEGRHVFTDRFYTGVDLAEELLKENFHITGTIMANRKNLPYEVKGKQLSKKKKGDIVALKKDDIVVVGWKDKRPVLVLTTFYGAKTEVVTRRKPGGAIEEIVKPSVVQAYTAKMGGVDRADHFCASYNFARKSKKWWRKLFFWILEVTIANSYILFSVQRTEKGLKPVRHLEFRLALIRQLVGDWRVQPKRKRPRSAEGDIERLNGLFHDLGKGKQRDCVVCSDRSRPNGRKSSVYFCKTCPTNPALCIENCFRRYHSVKKFRQN